MTENLSSDYPAESRSNVVGWSARTRVSWGAVTGGALVSLAVMLLLSLLGMSIGLAIIDPQASETGAKSVSIGAAIWWIVSTLIALGIGGWVAGRLGGKPNRLDGALHGLVVWAVVTVVSFFTVTTAIGRLVGGTASLLGEGAKAAGQGVASVAPEAAEGAKNLIQRQAGGANTDVIGQVAQAVRQANPNAPEQGLQEIQRTAQRLFREGGVNNPAAREELIAALTRTGLDRPTAERRVQEWTTTYQNAAREVSETKAEVAQKAREVGEDAANIAAGASLWAFINLLLGLIAAWFGGRRGSPRDELVVGTHAARTGV